MAAIPLRREIEYPESDGKPMAETPVHRQVMVDLLFGLERHFAGDPDVYIQGNMFVYYVEGNPRANVSPDVFVLPGVGRRPRRIVKLWEEGRVPSLIVEVTSASSRTEDLKTKKPLYERLGVEEYFLFDPLDEYLRPKLQGFRLEGGRYRPLAPGPDGSLLSRATGLRLRSEGEVLRLIDAAAGRPLPTVDEEVAARQAAEERARTAEEQTRTAEARAAALEEEIARLRAELSRRDPA